MPRVTKKDHQAAFSFMLFTFDHARNSFKYLLKHGTPDQQLLALSDDTSSRKHPVFPRSMHTRAGQQLALAMAKRVQIWKNDIPWMAYGLREQGYRAAAQERQTETRNWATAIVDTVLIRCTEERTPKVLLSYESLLAAVRALCGSAPHLTRVRGILERLGAAGAPFEIQHGKRGDFGRATRFLVQLPEHTDKISTQAQGGWAKVNDWQLQRGHGLFASTRYERAARAELAARKARYAAAVGGSIPEIETWIEQSKTKTGRSWRVGFPGDLVSSSSTAPQPPFGIPLVTSDSMPSDQARKKKDVPNSATRFWEMARDFDRQQRAREPLDLKAMTKGLTLQIT